MFKNHTLVHTLAHSKIGDKLKVINIAEGAFRSKLMEMGFYEGKEIEILFEAPLGDPIAVSVGDYVLSLRKEEASYIEVAH